MVTYAGVRDARPEQWKDAADDFVALARYVNQAAIDVRGDTAAKVDAHWADSTGKAAAARLYALADKLDSAYDLLDAVKMVLEGMHSSIQTAQATLIRALSLANEYGIQLDDEGRPLIVQNPVQIVSEIAALHSQAIKQATDADNAARAELAKLRAAVGITNPDDALNLQEEASHTEMDAFKGAIPTGQDPATVAAWWGGLSPSERHDLMLAEPVALTNLDGIPDSVKTQMRGPDGKYDRVKMVDYALRNWNRSDPIDLGDNCTNFVSEALLHAGMKRKMGTWSGVRGADDWGKETGTGWDWLDEKLYYSHTWGGAENQQDFMLKHGGEEVPPGQARPGDIIYYEQQGPNSGIHQGETHHAAIVTAVMPDGEIKYTQHSDSHVDVSLEGRLPHETESEGQQNIRIVRPHPDWY
ncbi:amidase domain-containing protein [Streptomyces sp. IBSBF 2435]|uniref:amidase domain-containing protein n=1 Tax=Streptomyces sp. IBSBF 2435 TaxID=2903531 RepID=UPI002FDC52BB